MTDHEKGFDPSQEEGMMREMEGDKKTVEELIAEQIAIFDQKYGAMSPEQIGSVLQGRNYHSQYELMRYARLTNKKQLADQIVSTLGRDGIRTALREATTNQFAPHSQREDLLEWHRRGQTEIGRFLDGRIIDTALGSVISSVRKIVGKLKK